MGASAMMDNIDPALFWGALGLVLAAAEIAVPGLFLIWMAGAALITALVAWLLPIGVAGQVILFAALALASVLAGRRWLPGREPVAADPMMNDRGARMVGKTVVVTEPIIAGSGRAQLGDGAWLVSGPDAPAGTRMIVTGNDGVILKVAPLSDELPDV